jgi:hypothetical protein
VNQPADQVLSALALEAFIYACPLYEDMLARRRGETKCQTGSKIGRGDKSGNKSPAIQVVTSVFASVFTSICAAREPKFACLRARGATQAARWRNSTSP